MRAVTFSRSNRPSCGIKSQMKKERTNVYQLMSVFSLLNPALIYNPNNLSGAGSRTLMRHALIKSGTIFFFPHPDRYLSHLPRLCLLNEGGGATTLRVRLGPSVTPQVPTEYLHVLISASISRPVCRDCVANSPGVAETDSLLHRRTRV